MNVTVGDDVAALAREYGPMVFRAAWRVLGTRAAVGRRTAAGFPAVDGVPATGGPVLARVSDDGGRRDCRSIIFDANAAGDCSPHCTKRTSPRIYRRRSRTRGSEPLHARRAGEAQPPRRVLLCHAAFAGAFAPAAIGAALGISENHVSVSVHRARKALEAMQTQEQNR